MKIIRNIILSVICLYALTGVTMHIQAAVPEPLKVGPGQLHTKLSEAILAAQEGQVIQIVGDITETNPVNPVIISKKVIIQGYNTPVYTIKGWAKETSPFQIAAAGVVIQDLNIVINGTTTTCKPIEITGDDFSLKRASITLTGTTNTVFAPISVNASGLTMEEVTIPNTTRAPVLVDLLGNGAVFKEVSITAGANTTGIYSAVSPAKLVLDACVFSATANTATLVSIPDPDGLTLTGCKFSFTFSASATADSVHGLNFTEASAADAVKTLEATGCVFNMNAPATAINLNGYNGVFTGCEFNYSKGGTAISSQSPGNADLIFSNCAFYMGKNGGEKPASAKGLDLKYNEQGNIVIDGCTLIASCNPEGAAATTAVSARIINAEDGTLRSLTIRNSDIALNTGATGARGVSANAELLTITKSNFNANARTAKCVVVNGVTSGNISDSVFDIAQADAVGLSFTDSGAIHLKNNIYNVSTAGTGAVMSNTAAGVSSVVAENNEITIQGQVSKGLLVENFSSLEVKNGTTITAVAGGKNSAGISANQVKTVDMDGLELDLNGATQGVAVDGTKFPQGEEGSVRITNMTAKLSGGISKSVSVIFSKGVLIDNYYGVCDETAGGSNLLSFNSTVGVDIKNSAFELYKSSTGINVAATTVIAEPRDENGTVKKHMSGNYEIRNNQFYVGESAKAMFFGLKNTHNTEIHNNLFKANKAAGIVTVGYGRSQMVYDNIFESVDSLMAIVSDGVDETAEFSMDADDDIYVDGGIVDAYRNQFYNNKLKGSYERGFYITNNGDVVRDNDLSEATFHYESIPGTIANTQVIVAYCKDVKILDNRFAKARSADNQVIRIYNAIMSEVTGNTTQPVGGASEVLFVQGTTGLAPNKVKYPEKIEVHDTTNTINGVTPVEIVKEWDNPDNLIYEYILSLPEYPYTVAYYKDFAGDENLLAVEQGYSVFTEGHVLTASEVAADLGADWMFLYHPEGYPDAVASNIGGLVIQSNAAENVVVVVYLNVPAIVTEPETESYFAEPEVRRRASTSGTNEIYVEIDEPEVPLGPPPQDNPNPETGKTGTLVLYTAGFIAIAAAVPFWIKRKRKRANNDTR